MNRVLDAIHGSLGPNSALAADLSHCAALSACGCFNTQAAVAAVHGADAAAAGYAQQPIGHRAPELEGVLQNAYTFLRVHKWWWPQGHDGYAAPPPAAAPAVGLAGVAALGGPDAAAAAAMAAAAELAVVQAAAAEQAAVAAAADQAAGKDTRDARKLTATLTSAFAHVAAVGAELQARSVNLARCHVIVNHDVMFLDMMLAALGETSQNAAAAPDNLSRARIDLAHFDQSLEQHQSFVSSLCNQPGVRIDSTQLKVLVSGL